MCMCVCVCGRNKKLNYSINEELLFAIIPCVFPFLLDVTLEWFQHRDELPRIDMREEKIRCHLKAQHFALICIKWLRPWQLCRTQQRSMPGFKFNCSLMVVASQSFLRHLLQSINFVGKKAARTTVARSATSLCEPFLPLT